MALLEIVQSTKLAAIRKDALAIKSNVKRCALFLPTKESLVKGLLKTLFRI